MLEFAMILDCLRNLFLSLRDVYYPLGEDDPLEVGTQDPERNLETSSPSASCHSRSGLGSFLTLDWHSSLFCLRVVVTARRSPYWNRCAKLVAVFYQPSDQGRPRPQHGVDFLKASQDTEFFFCGSVAQWILPRKSAAPLAPLPRLGTSSSHGLLPISLGGSDNLFAFYFVTLLLSVVERLVLPGVEGLPDRELPGK